MKEEALALARQVQDPAQKLNILREYIQALALRSLHDSEAFVQLAFVGGTALRFLYAIPRFSEDLDFSLQNQVGYAPDTWMKKLKEQLILNGFVDASVSLSERTTVHKAWIKVGGVLYDAGLAGMRDQKLSIKLEVDTRPPIGAEIQRTIVTRHRLLAIQHFSPNSLMAGKLHALLTRKYPKGRDWYDLMWYSGQRPPLEPNLTLLQNALDQTQGPGVVSAHQWRSLLLKKLETLNVVELAEDVAPFLERPEDRTLLSPDNLRSVLQ